MTTRSAYAVIGANFGDEGKGLMTDYLTQKVGATMVGRFNGGAQAGHTVETYGGLRHVFGHIASGTFAGADTYLGSNFLVNPHVLEKEIVSLQKMGFDPRINVHPGALVTTIIDMAINAAIEQKRGADRHGSCGLGINETMQRSSAGFGILALELKTCSVKTLAEKIEHIFTSWVQSRMNALDLSTLPFIGYQRNFQDQARRLIVAAQYLDLLVIDVDNFTDHVGVLEGAQGLMLDEELGEFPNVTHSITGLPSAMSCAKEMGFERVRPVYVTRCYLTRHGAGNLKHENVAFCERDVFDYTNVDNEWQGKLRYAPLNLPDLSRFIKADLARVTQPENVMMPLLAVTCLDQIGSSLRVVNMKNELETISTANVTSFIEEQLGVTVGYESWGSTANNVVQIKENGV